MQSFIVVNTAANSQDLTVLATVKAECGITTTTEDANIETWIDQASSACSAYCNRVFGKETVTETFRNRFSYLDRNANRADTILLSRNPVTVIVSVTQDNTVLTENVDFEVDYTEGIMYRLDSNQNSVQWSFSKLVVNYTAGWDLLGTLPDSIERACISHVKALRSSADRDPNVKQESIPGVLETSYWIGQIGSNGALSPEVTSLLDPYRNVGV